ncbi:MAG: YbhB/YbcL family Raf kinase inhibitor-like protein [Planctomycetota bacterium]
MPRTALWIAVVLLLVGIVVLVVRQPRAPQNAGDSGVAEPAAAEPGTMGTNPNGSGDQEATAGATADGTEADGNADQTEGATAMLTITSRAFDADQPIPERYSGEGENVSPPLAWDGAPEGTASIALIVDDPDAPREDPFVHWVLVNLPADARELAEGSAGGGTEGKNSADRTGYMGPMPPPGHGTHHYHFKVYALDTTLDLAGTPTKTDVLRAMEGHVLAEGELVGTYER